MKGFTFSENYYNTVSDPDNGLSEEQKAVLYKAIIEHVFSGSVPELKGVSKALFNALLPSLDKSKMRSKAGQKIIKTQSNEEQNKNKNESKSNQNQIKAETKINFDFEREREFPQNEKERSKEKENISPQEKEKNISLSTGAQASFFRENPSIVIDNYDPSVLSRLTEENWNSLIEQFKGSEWLRKNVKTMSTLCRMVDRILAGAYAPFEKVGNTDQGENFEENERKRNAEWFDATFGKHGG